jgi:hypothetical protein
MNVIKLQLLKILNNSIFGFNFGIYNGFIFSFLSQLCLKFFLKATSKTLTVVGNQAANVSFFAVESGFKGGVSILKNGTKKSKNFVYPLVIKTCNLFSAFVSTNKGNQPLFSGRLGVRV